MKRVISAVLCLFLVFALLPASAHAAGGVSINKTNFPDENFRSYVKKFDTNGNGYLNSSELAAVTEIDCSSMGIKSLKGVEYFTNLDTLMCYSNQLSALDMSANTKLWYLECGYNEISKLDVSKNKQLSMLYCDNNKLTSLNVSANTVLHQLSCAENQISKLDVSKNKKLYYLNCSQNKLTSLNVSANTGLEALFCSGNQITKLNVSRNTKLIGLTCSGNSIATIDISKCPELVKYYQDGVQEILNNRVVLYSIDNSQWMTFDLSTKVVCPTVKPRIKEQPNAVKVENGKLAKFTVLSTGGGQTYQWYYHTATDDTWKRVSINGTSNVYTLAAQERHDGNVYRCKITNASGSVYTKEVKLTVISAPKVTEQPKNRSIKVGANAIFAVRATGNELSYQWQYQKPGESTWHDVRINGTSRIYKLLNAQTRHSGYIYRCRISNPLGTVYSETVTLTVKK